MKFIKPLTKIKSLSVCLNLFFLTVTLCLANNIQNTVITPPVVIKAQMQKYYELKNIDIKEAEILLTYILKADPKNIEAQTEMGYVLLKNNQLIKAIEAFDKALTLTPDNEVIKKQITFINSRLKAEKSTPTSVTISESNVVPAAPNNVVRAAPDNVDNMLNQYYALKKTDAKKASLFLTQILKKYPTSFLANAERGYELVKDNKMKEALNYFIAALKQKPNDQNLIKQIKALKNTVNPAKKAPQIATKPLSLDQQFLNEYYNLKKTNPAEAKIALQKAIFTNWQNISAQREMAYLLLNEKNMQEALAQFKVVENLEPYDYKIKMQIAYILDGLNKKRSSYFYFKKATKTTDPELRLKANQAMTALAGSQTKILPDPWFADFYFSPFYFSRFNLWVYPSQVRFGRTFGKNQTFEIYFINRRTSDSRSGELEDNIQLPQIFEDNVSIYSLGARYAPFPRKIPGLRLYAERGRAYDLIERPPNPRWRNDFRGGLLFDTRWGVNPEYVEDFKMPFKQVGKIYSDVSYFTRYNNNIIWFYSIKEGLRIAQYHTSQIDLYARLRGSADKNKEFFNNFVEIGPGLEFTPNNRYSFSVRLEYVKGYYIKVDSPSPNPYGPTYHNKIAIAEIYLRM